jgi:hypothetical protein
MNPSRPCIPSSVSFPPVKFIVSSPGICIKVKGESIFEAVVDRALSLPSTPTATNQTKAYKYDQSNYFGMSMMSLVTRSL